MSSLSTLGSPDKPYIRKGNVFDAQIHDEIVMLCLDRDFYFSLDEIGARVWNILAEPHSLGQICDVLCAEYDVDVSTALAEIGVLLQDLLTNGLILPAANDFRAAGVNY